MDQASLEPFLAAAKRLKVKKISLFFFLLLNFVNIASKVVGLAPDDEGNGDREDVQEANEDFSEFRESVNLAEAVSYTHLTLPTIYSV